DRFSWLRDDEFARQALAGVNPVSIEKLKVFPPVSQLDPEIYGRQESALKEEHILGYLNGMSVQQAIEENKLFIIDYHDIYLPFLDRINALDERKAYATRTIFFLTPSGTLKPIAFELSLPRALPGSQLKRVLTPPVDATSNWTWQLAKAHVCSNDAGVHQLSHHCAAAYKHWRFDLEGLPADLIRRGMAVPDPSQRHGLKLLIEDYPYASDGLLIWEAIQTAQHAALNFGQYPYGGYIPNLAPRMRLLIPDENDPEYASFLEDPQNYFLLALPSMLQSTKYMAVVDTLSTHSPDEEYIGERQQRDTETRGLVMLKWWKHFTGLHPRFRESKRRLRNEIVT
ncbi:linoleate 13S-lipoxygenase 3-1, chloroplastic, partial [Tanacetum coccineum]